MAFEQTIVWTCLPNGVAPAGAGGPRMLMSVHVAPRLTNLPSGNETTLASFPDWADWPSHSQGFRAQVEILAPGPGTGVYDAPATITPDLRRSDVWTALFPGSTPVESRHSVDTFRNVPVISYSPSNVVGYLRDNYVKTAQSSPSEFPSYADLIAWLDPLGYGDREGPTRLKKVLGDLAAERQQGGARANSFANADPQRDFAALREFHRPRSVKSIGLIKPPTLDFHAAVGLAGEHGLLLRLLGLAFDLELDVSGIPLQSTPVHARVSVVPSFPSASGSSHNVLPATRCLLGTGAFEAEPSGASAGLAGRYLRVGDGSEYDVIQVDQDGAGLKANGLADNLQLSRSADMQTEDTPDSYSLPTLRSGGLSIVRRERATRFVGALDRSDALNKGITGASSLPDLFLEDVVRGYALDVHDKASGNWHSVCTRTGQYHFPTVASNQDVAVTEDAAIDSPPTGPADPNDPKKFHLQQSLARWSGWSLAAPPPGKPISSHDNTDPEDEGTPPFPVDFQLRATALPRLRFGVAYALRMRAVDLVGNAPGLTATPAVGDSGKRVTDEQPYLRFEPIPAPGVETRADPAPAESLHGLVIRGNFDQDATGESVRYVIPPRGSQLLCEHHGKFDVPSGGGVAVDKNAYALIAARESAQYDRSQPLATSAAVPYLPDPIARGAAFRVLDGQLAGTVFKDMSFIPAWPDARPFELRIVHGAAPGWDQNDSGRVVTVQLTKADVIRVRLSSTMKQDDLDLLGVHGWVKAAGNPSPDYLQAALDGQHWLTTPYTELVLVYAVRQPLAAPALADVTPQRNASDTFARVLGHIDFDGKSTGKLEMRARWIEAIDGGPGTPAPSGPGAPDASGRNAEVRAFDIPITAQLLADHRFSGRHEFHDTKHRRVAYQTIATSKFTANFAEHVDATPAANGAITLSGLGVEPRSVVVTKDDGTRLVEGPDFSVAPAQGTVSFPNAPGKVRIDFFPPVSRATPALPAVVNGPSTPNGLPVLDIPSSARPAAPVIAFVVPIFKWDPVKKSGATIKSARSPSALRVYLERPWWSSGVDELLGVVTWPGGEGGSSATIDKKVAPFVSDWGRDPIFNSPALPSPHPKLSSFPSSPPALHGTGLTIDERAGMLVNVAGHAVAYDPARGLWYCDIHLNVGKSYTPIVRLALARYQQHSVAGVELSRIVLADFMQIAPGRGVTVVQKKGKVTVTVSGQSYTKAAKAIPGPGYARAFLERRDKSLGDDPVLGWKQVGDAKTLHAESVRGGKVWVGTLDMPSGRGEYRIAVEQYEELPADRRGRGLLTTTGRRLVFSDVIPLKP